MSHDDIRQSYDTVAVNYAEVNDRLGPVDRAMLGLVAELSDGPIADLGCGPGRTTAHLVGLGAEAYGVDLSPGMVEVARGLWPGIRFEVGSIQALDAPDAALAGIVAFYSIIHTATEELPLVFAEFARVLRAAGHVLLAFQLPAGQEPDEKAHIESGYGHAVSIDVWRRRPELIVGMLETAGFTHVATSIREPEGTEKTRQAHVLVRRGPRP